MWWRDHQKVSLTSFSDKHIFILVDFDYSANHWVANGIYGWSDRASKSKTWDLMRSLVHNVYIPFVYLVTLMRFLARMRRGEGGVLLEIIERLLLLETTLMIVILWIWAIVATALLGVVGGLTLLLSVKD